MDIEFAINWLLQRTGEKQEYISSFNFAVKRSYYETLLYSVMGLERLYTTGRNGKQQQLKQRIPAVIKNASAKEIEKIYELRSAFAHGSISMVEEYISEENWSLAQKAFTILICSIRELVRNNARQFEFQINISYSCS